MYFLLAWLHAIVQERLRYSPLGWSKVYEFSESDLRVACDTLDTWIDSVSQVCVVVFNSFQLELLNTQFWGDFCYLLKGFLFCYKLYYFAGAIEHQT